MAKYKIEVDKEKCIGCAACAAQSDNFEMDGDKAKPKQAEVDDKTSSQAGADVCPVDAISMKEMS